MHYGRAVGDGRGSERREEMGAGQWPFTHGSKRLVQRSD